MPQVVFRNLGRNSSKSNFTDTFSIFLIAILIRSETLQEYADHVRRVSVTLHPVDLNLKPKNCKYFQLQVDYLGYSIDLHWHSTPTQRKWTEWEIGQNPQQWRASDHSSGFATNYRRFVKDFAEIAEPLTNLTKKYRRFSWDEGCEAAFEALNKTLITAQTLSHSDYNSFFYCGHRCK